MPKRTVNTSKTSPAKLAAKDKAIQAMELRKRGYAFQAIAKELGYASESGARNAVNRLLAKTEFEAVTDYRKLKLLQLDELYKGVQRALTNAKGEISLWAVDRLQAIIDQQAKLLGLYAATQVDIFDWRKEFQEAGLDSDELYAQFLEAATRVKQKGG